jgi:hypothetical protein
MAVPAEPPVTLSPELPEAGGCADVAAARRLGTAGLVAAAVSFALTAAVALLGPSLMEPALPGAAGQPPWSLAAHPTPYLVVALSGAGIAAAVIGLSFIFKAIQRGWSISPRLVLLAGIAGALLLALLPPFGSSDHLSYAAYGRMAVTGHNPYTTTPAALARLGDPVARAVQDWRTSPSVYGSLAVAIQALAAWIGGTSVRLIVFVLSVINVAAFAGTGLILHWLGRGDEGRQLRSAVLWTANPLLLMVLVAGAHVDSQAIIFGVGAVAAVAGLRPAAAPLMRQVLAAAAAGALIGLGFAIKVTTALVGAGIALGIGAAWRQCRQGVVVLGGLAAGFCVLAVVTLIPWGTAMFGPALRAGSYTSIGSPWRAVRSGLKLLIGEHAAQNVIRAGALLLAVGLLLLLVKYISDTRWQLVVAGSFAFVFAWLLAWPYVLPWYDGLGWALLALLPASRFDWLMLARTAALAIGYLPARGIPLPAGLGWLETVVRTAITPAALLVIVAVTIVWLWPWRRARLAAA